MYYVYKYIFYVCVCMYVCVCRYAVNYMLLITYSFEISKKRRLMLRWGTCILLFVI